MFLTVSTPPFNIGKCNKYDPECIGRTQKTLFYISLALMSLGGASRVSQFPFFEEQEEKQEDEAMNSNIKNKICDCSIGQQLGCLLVVVATIIGGFVLPFINLGQSSLGLQQYVAWWHYSFSRVACFSIPTNAKDLRGAH